MATATPPTRDGARLVRVPAGAYRIGSEDERTRPEDAEGPARTVEVGEYWIDAHAVSNDRFGAFVEDTGYVTVAEQWGWSFVFVEFLPEDFAPTRAVQAAPWWRQVNGADWRHPEGPHSDLAGRGDHPVVHMALVDAVVYCAWAELRLPTEAEWEIAARGGLDQALYPWGDELEPGGEHRCNIWQGSFPDRNDLLDGYAGTCPVDAFPPNGYGLHNTSGNVWEWTTDRFGPDHGDEIFAIRGGSYLCHDSYCDRYRVSARTGNTAESSTGHQGFRCAWSAEPPAPVEAPTAATGAEPNGTGCCAPSR